VLELGVEAIEPKWGQGAKDIGGEVKLPTIERALQLKKRGYIVYPDPEDPVVQKAYKEGAIKEFERHSRLGMVEEEAFYKEVERLRKLGFKYVTLKTGAYRPADLARAVKYSSVAKIDLLTVDGASGGTGMSPWRMMNEWGIPTVELESMLYNMLRKIEEKGMHVPPRCDGRRVFAGRSHFQGPRAGSAVRKGYMHGKGYLRRDNGRKDRREPY